VPKVAGRFFFAKDVKLSFKGIDRFWLTSYNNVIINSTGMALATVTENYAQLRASSGPKGVLNCEGTLADGAAFRVRAGKLFVDDGSGTFIDGDNDQKNSVLALLQVEFGKERVRQNEDGDLIFNKTSVEKTTDVVDAGAKRVGAKLREVFSGLDEPDDSPDRMSAHRLGMVSVARRLLLEGKTDDEVNSELATQFAGIADLDQKIQQALDLARKREGRERANRHQALREKIHQRGLEIATADPTLTDAQVRAQLKTEFKNVVLFGRNIERSDSELDEMIEEAHKRIAKEADWEASKQKWNNRIRNGAKWSQDNLVPSWGTVKKAAKLGALGAAGTAIVGGAAVLGAGALALYGAKKLAQGVYKAGKFALPLAGNVAKHAWNDGGNVLKAAGHSLILNPIKAVGRVISSPFKRGYQAFNWGRNYVDKPEPKKGKGIFGPALAWMQNTASSAWYRTKQAGLALGAMTAMTVYGGIEGGVNAVSQDLIGTDWHAPEPHFPEKRVGSSRPAASNAGHGAGHGAGHAPAHH
jgi:hypothetical protein